MMLQAQAPIALCIMYREASEGTGDWTKAGIKLDADTIAAAVEQSVRGGKYLQFNLKFDGNAELPEVAQALHCMRQAHADSEWGWNHATVANIQDYRRATLVLLGIEATGTQGHVDWSEANNVAFAFEEVSASYSTYV